MKKDDLYKSEPRTFTQWRKAMKTKWLCFLHIVIYPDRVLKRISKMETEIMRLRLVEKGIDPGPPK